MNAGTGSGIDYALVLSAIGLFAGLLYPLIGWLYLEIQRVKKETKENIEWVEKQMRDVENRFEENFNMRSREHREDLKELKTEIGENRSANISGHNRIRDEVTTLGRLMGSLITREDFTAQLNSFKQDVLTLLQRK